MGITWRQALAWRLERQYLGSSRAGSVDDVVRRLSTVPAWSGDAGLAIALRRRRPAPGDLDRALAEGRLLKTFSFRGSMQLMAPDTAGDFLALRGAGRQWELRSWREFYRLEPADWPGFRERVRAALADGPLTQPELAAVVSADPRYAHLADALNHRSVTLIKPLAWQGDLSLAPSRDGRLTFQAPASAPGWTGIPSLDDAGPRAVIAYFSAYGPAGRDRVHSWLGDGLSAGRKRIDGWLDALGDRLTELDVDGDRVFCLAEHADEIAATEPASSVRLLPGLDQWVLGPGTDEDRVVPSAQRTPVTRGANLAVVDGRVSGAWTQASGAIEVTWFRGVEPPTGRALAEEIARLGGLD